MKNVLLFIYNLLFRNGYNTFFWKRKFGKFGEKSKIEYPSILQNTECIEIGSNTIILKNSRIQSFYDGFNNPIVKIGDGCFIGYNFSLLNASKIEIGNNVLLASNILISSENHGMNPECNLSYMDQPLQSSPVIIGDGCWIGEKVCILPGVVIGEKTIIGAGSIVTKSIPAYSVAVGNPARVIKKYNLELHKWESV